MKTQLPLPADRSSPARARRFIRETLGPYVSNLDVVELCISELVANAVLHAHTGCEVVLDVGPAAVRIEVRDYAPARLPQKRDFDRTAVTGRGLHLIDTLTEDWGVDVDRDSKSVWFVVTADRARAGR